MGNEATIDATAAGAFDRLDAHSPVHGLRQRAFERYGELGLPTTSDEAWRYTSTKAIARTAFGANHAGDATEDDVTQADVAAHRLPLVHELVFVNGRFAPDLSIDATAAGIRLETLADVIASDFAAVESHLGRHAAFDDAAFTALNTAHIEDGAFLQVPPGTKLEKPVHLLFVTTAGAEPRAVHPRVLLLAGAGSAITVVESYVTIGAGSTLTNAVTEMLVEEGAVVDHYKIQAESDDAFHVSTLHVKQVGRSDVTSHDFTVGGSLVRHDIQCILDAEGCNATFNGLYLIGGRQHVDNHLRIEHRKPNCNSWEFYKGVLDDRSTAVFTGRIFVDHDAQKTDAKQTNMNLLLSDDARVNTMPQLEIFADDVKCTHGATIGQIEESQLFYLQSRGIDRETARSLLIYAFANETISEVRIDALRERLRAELRDRLPVGHLLQEEL